MVDPARVDKDWTVGRFSALTIGVSIEAADIGRYRDAVLRFWSIEGIFLGEARSILTRARRLPFRSACSLGVEPLRAPR